MNRILLQRSVFNIKMLIVVLIVVTIYFHELFVNENFFGIDWSQNQSVDVLELHMSVFALSFFSITAGMFPGIPYGFSLLEERNSGYLKYELSRMSTKRYIRKKIFFVGLSGVFTMAIPYIILMIPIGIAGVPTTKSVHPDIMEQLVWGKVLYIWGGYLVIVLKGILVILFGILWAEVSLLISLFVRNKYIAFVLPFIAFQLCWLLEPADGWLRMWNPLYMISFNFDATESLACPFLVFLIYIIIISINCEITFRRQVKNGKL